MKIKITLGNNSDAKEEVSLFGLSFHQPNDGIPKDVLIHVAVEEKDGAWNDDITSYKDLLAHCIVSPIAIQINKTTSNRQLNFYYLDIFGMKNPLIPQLAKDGEQRPRNDEWDSKKWNIADTHEILPLDNKFIIDVSLKPKQTFTMILDHIKTINLTHEPAWHFKFD